MDTLAKRSVKEADSLEQRGGDIIHRRTVPLAENLEVRTVRDADKGASDGSLAYVDGYWAVFGTTNWYDEILVAGSADETIEERGPRTLEGSDKRSSKIKMLWQHLSEEVLGLPEQLKPDDYGIWGSTPVRLKDRNGNWNQKRVDYLDQVEAGEVDSFSIGFIADEIEYEWVEGRERDTAEPPDMIDWFFGDAIRKVVKMTLFEGSLVTFPAEENALVDRASEAHQAALALRSMTENKRDAYISRITSIPRELVTKAREVLDELDQAIAAEEEEETETPAEEEDTTEPEETPESEEEDEEDELDEEELAAQLEEVHTGLSLMTLETRMRRERS
jgi:HK97 family phage prohead protease